MEEVIFVQRRDRRSHPQVLRVRDNGEYEVADTGSPSPTAVLIGQFREFLCFRDSDRSSFLVWNFRTRTLQKEIGFSAADPNAEAVAGFAKTAAGEVRIVLVARSGLSFSTRVYRGEEDERGLEKEKEEGGNGQQEPRPDGWGEWVLFGGNRPFKPYQDQLARFTVSAGVSRIYWAGSNFGRNQIVSIDIETENVRLEDPPLDLPGVRVNIGHGIAGELAASVLEEVGCLRFLRVWCLRGAGWVHVARIIVNNDPPQSYLPLSIYNRRPDQQTCYVFLKNTSSIVRITPPPPAEEELFVAQTTVFTSTLPQGRYHYENAEWSKNRTPEEEEEARRQKRRRIVKGRLGFDISEL